MEKKKRLRPDETIVGNKYHMLTVIAEAPYRNKHGDRLWICLCDCQWDLPEEERKYTVATKSDLERESKGVKSCGCLKAKTSRENGLKNKRENVFDLKSEEYGIGYTIKGNAFLFDKEDYQLIKGHYWSEDFDGFNSYLRADKGESRRDRHSGKLMHVVIMNHYWLNPLELHVDHINGNTLDNRKKNLRYVDDIQSAYNRKTRIDNTSGYKGVALHKMTGKWQVNISVNKKTIYLGLYENIEDAIRVRKEAEEKYFGEYARRDK